MTDALAIAWKEWHELLGQRGVRGKFGVLLFVAVFGIVIPLQNGPTWITSPSMVIAWAWAPMFLVINVIADAIAGERERHTLETLFASRVSDGAILLGKIGAASGYAAAVTTASLSLGVVAVNLAYARGGILLYPLRTVLVMCVLGVLGALFVAALGVLVSLRSATVRHAQQILSGTIMLLLMVPLVGARLLPAAWRHTLLPDPAALARLELIAVAAFVVLDAGVMALTFSQFTRSRLIPE